jgi:hypothetical protein
VTKPSQQVPVRTFADWKDPLPGYLEIDFVAHGGSSMGGTFLWSLVATDVCSGWTEVLPLVAREQSLVVEGLKVTTAKVVLARLEQSYPGRFPEGQLRTLQRVLCEWHRVMARELVHGVAGGAIGAKAAPDVGEQPK